MPIANVIAATDFSAPAHYAVERAAMLAAAHGVRLRLLHSINEGDWLQRWKPDQQGPGGRQQWRQWAESALSQECERLRGQHACELEAEVVDEPLAEALGRLGHPSAEALVVIGARGEGGMREALLGSTADRLLRCGQLPVLLVRNKPLSGYRKVVLGTNFSDASRLGSVYGLALTPQADHYLLHASQQPPDRELAFASRSPETLDLFRSEALADAGRDLAGFADGLGQAGRELIRAPRQGTPARVFEHFVRETGADLAVLGARSRARWEANLLGSTALFAVTGLACDVLLVPHLAD